MKLTRLAALSAVLLFACGGTGESSNPLGSKGGGQPIGQGKPGAGDPVGVITNPGQTGSGGSGQGGSGAVSGTGGVSGSGGGGNLTCDSVCAGCGYTPDQCASLCGQFEFTQDQLACLQSTNCSESCLSTSGSGGSGGGSQCLEDGSSCELGSECCAQVCTDGFCGTPSAPQCGLPGDACSFPEDCCSFNCDGICF